MADLTTMSLFPDKDEEWWDLFEECHRDEWREEYYERDYERDYEEDIDDGADT